MGASKDKMNMLLEEDGPRTISSDFVGRQNSFALPTAASFGGDNHKIVLEATSANVEGPCKVGTAKSSSSSKTRKRPRSKKMSYDDDDDVMLEISSSGRIGATVPGGDQGDRSIDLMLQHLVSGELLTQRLEKTLRNEESECEEISLNREKLQGSLHRERLKAAEIQSKLDVKILSQASKIEELQRKLAEVKGACKSPSGDKATGITPSTSRTPPPTTTTIRSKHVSWEDCETGLID